jgi:acetolactate synthase-1/2/3 large subunit
MTETTENKKTTAASLLAQTLVSYGATHVFFVDAILRYTLIELERLGVRRILAHSEKAAAYMADGYARASGRPGICFAQSVGAANLAAGLQDAYLARSPVVAITGRKQAELQYRNAYQEVIHHPLYAAVTKFNVNVETVGQLPHVLRQAFREAVSGTPRPVHLDLQGLSAQLSEIGEVEAAVIVEDDFAHVASHRPCAEEQRLRGAAEALAAANRPVIVAGAGAAASGAGPEIVELAEALSIPVATSTGGKGLIREDHPLSVGVVGRYSRRCANQVVSEADLVMYVGSHTGDLVTHDWRVPRPGGAVIQIDIDPLELGRNYPNTLGLMGDPKATLRGLLGVVDGALAKHAKWAEWAGGVVEAWKRETAPFGASDAAPIRVERLCAEVTRVLPQDAILVADTGFSGVWTANYVPILSPEQMYMSAAGSLGWSLPASLGAKCAAPDRPVVCFTGDGGFYYHLPELETAVRSGINTVTVVNDNSVLQQSKTEIDVFYQNLNGNKDELMAFGRVNFARIAEEFGCRGIRVERPQDLAPALAEALTETRPVVVDVVTDPEHPAPEPWTPGAEGMGRSYEH